MAPTPVLGRSARYSCTPGSAAIAESQSIHLEESCHSCQIEASSRPMWPSTSMLLAILKRPKSPTPGDSPAKNGPADACNSASRSAIKGLASSRYGPSFAAASSLSNQFSNGLAIEMGGSAHHVSRLTDASSVTSWRVAMGCRARKRAMSTDSGMSDPSESLRTGNWPLGIVGLRAGHSSNSTISSATGTPEYRATIRTASPRARNLK
mmetsp:Transcript_129463/g.414951  ORF Transcript_129463/g.414951 Transcript_129463/m.414951 type:complete len:208 (+) Transcript_129463:551-1174(+)